MDIATDLYTLFKYIFLGFIQGFTEPIPISSSGHVLVIRKLFDLHIEGLSFEIIVNCGSLIAILIVYRKDLSRIILHSFYYLKMKDNRFRADFIFVLQLLSATFLTGVIGILVKDYISDQLNQIYTVGITLLITGSALWLIRNLNGNRQEEDITLKDAIIIGVAQSVALIPGISRSGATIVAAMMLGIRQETALRFSFLLYIPVSLGITMMAAKDIIYDPNITALFIPYLLAFFTSVIATFYTLKWFINVMAKGKLKYFAFYCFIAGLFILLCL